MNHYDVVVIGSGFGGSVAAVRLTEKGYRVLVLEAGARFEDHEFAKNSFDLKRFLFFPRLGMLGIQRIDFLKNVLVMSGAGVGGGSLVYANTLYRPPKSFYQTGSWVGLEDWEKVLAPHFEVAEKMLGVNVNRFHSDADKVLLQIAKKRELETTFRATPVGVFFGHPDLAPGTEVPDPYFSGLGPTRKSCVNCGECMTGCRHGAKNTLVKNYLYLAERAGAEIWELTTVASISNLDRAAGFELSLSTTHRSGLKRPGTITADQVIVAAGALGTAKLLQKSVAKGKLSGVSNKLGHLSRTNSESLLGVVANNSEHDFSRGVAITSSIFPSENTHIESVRYGRGSGFMGLLQSVLASGKNFSAPNPFRLILKTLTNLHRLPSFYNLRTWPERTLILLVMQSLDNSLITYVKKNIFGRTRITSRQGHGQPNPSWNPLGHSVAKDIAAEIGGTAGAVVGEPFGIPLTAHFIGGAVIGSSAENSVVDRHLKVHGVPGLHIWDGSTLSANPGVNPSLSITAQAEWAASHWPVKA